MPKCRLDYIYFPIFFSVSSITPKKQTTRNEEGMPGTSGCTSQHDWSPDIFRLVQAVRLLYHQDTAVYELIKNQNDLIQQQTNLSNGPTEGDGAEIKRTSCY